MTILAYVDPGMGALVWQTVVAAFVGFVFYLKETRRWIVNMFLKIFRRGQKPQDAGLKIPPAEKVEAETDVR
jgi:hypothetical protein